MGGRVLDDSFLGSAQSKLYSYKIRMFITNFQLFNYKSYFESELLTFTPGINIIVGKNNSGKTALLEALTLKLSNDPHRSIKTLPSPSSRTTEESKIKVSLYLEKEELLALLEQIPPPIGLPKIGNHTSPDEEITPHYEEIGDVIAVVEDFQKWLDTPGRTHITLSLSSNPQFGVEKGAITDGLTFSLCNDLPIRLYDRRYQFIEIQRINNTYCPKLTYEDVIDPDGNYWGSEPIDWKSYAGDNEQTIGYKVFNLFRSRIYRFQAERLNVGSCPDGKNSELKPDASNLAEVLHLLASRDPNKFYCFNNYISIIFPQIAQISVPAKDNSTVEIRAWSIEAAKNSREDLTFPLTACGTGISQALAILYVVLTSQYPRTIIIDEPQSFLHPGAAKKLVEILKEFPQHQYFIATHSPEIVTAANPSTIVNLQYENSETKASVIDSEVIEEQRSLLYDLGVSLSDIFGADNILWVEGPTEEGCFPLILEKVAKKKLRGIQILAVKNTGDFESKRKFDIIFDIYEKLSGGKNLFPPAIKFIFDREGRSEEIIEDWKRRSQKLVEFLPRRMYENYLLHPEAIAAIINGDYSSQQASLTTQQVQERLDKKRQERGYYSNDVDIKELSASRWVYQVHGANLLRDLFNEFTEAQVEFRKTTHSYKLTNWLIENQPNYLSELTEFLTNMLPIAFGNAG